jgi:hypothetical protein
MTLKITTHLPPITYKEPESIKSMLAYSAASAAGYSAVSNFLSCPEKARLQKMGVKSVDDVLMADKDYVDELNALEYGTLIHALRAIRFASSHDVMMGILERYKLELLPSDYEAARMLMLVYESCWPRNLDPFEILGVEAEVISDIGHGELRSVRYDTVIRYPLTKEIFSFEAKTAARGGASGLSPYFPQGMSQTTIWNKNPHLVAQYGEMRGSFFEQFVKTNTPSVARLGPYYWTKRHQLLASNYLVAPGRTVVFYAEPEGNAPRQLHSCWGRFRACEYMPLCHEQEFGSYRFSDGRRYGGE